MRVPGASDATNEAPPPLPPPRYPLGQDPSHQIEDMKERRSYGHGQSLSSGYGSMSSSHFEERPNYLSRDRLGERDEGYSSFSSTEKYVVYMLKTFKP